MAINLPSRTAAIMPQPHEQKLQEVVNSFTFASFKVSVAALTAGKSTRPSSARPALPATATFNQSLRLTDTAPARREASPSSFGSRESARCAEISRSADTLSLPLVVID